MNLMAIRWQNARSASAAAEFRAQELERWLTTHAPECMTEQKHLDEGSAERAYWHYGYLSALRDIIKLMSTSTSEN